MLIRLPWPLLTRASADLGLSHPTAVFPDPTVSAVEKYLGEDYVVVRGRGLGNEESPLLLTAYRVHNGKLRKVTGHLPLEMIRE